MTTADYSSIDLSNGVNRGRLRNAAARGDRQAKAALEKWEQAEAKRDDRRVTSVAAARDAYLDRQRRTRRVGSSGGGDGA